MLINNDEYFTILEEIKAQIKAAQYRGALGLNREQIVLYWNIGKIIIRDAKWGSKFIDNLARDIKLEFPYATGYSSRNLKYMRKFAEIFGDDEIVPTLLAQLTWSHHRLLMDKVKDKAAFIWYADKTVENGLSKNALWDQIDNALYERQAISDKTSNYQNTLSPPQSKLAEETLKDPYVFSFIEQRKGIIEREIESEMVANIAKTLLELGTGFAFVGHQYPIEVDDKEYSIDLLFYNLELRCYVVVELKNTIFKPEYAGKLNFYLSAVDDMLKREFDNPSIGILLCREHGKLTAEYALRDINKPIGVSEYRLSDFVPAELADTLPSAEDIEKRIKKNIT